MATSKTNTRSGRSNSLQRMLELEKQCMFERHRPYSPPGPPSPKAQSPGVIATKQSPRVQSSIQARRAKGTMQTNMRPSSSHETRPDRAKAPQLPPLVINTGGSIMMSPPDLLKFHGRESSPMGKASSIVSTPNDKYAKVVSFEFPPTESEAAPCHSPSWEAYERRKTEKKTEKREREESRNGKSKRLVKPPPTSSVYSLQQAAASDVEANRGRQRERPSTATSANTTSTAPRKARSRSSSFVSMLRAPFEFRRQSVDHTQDAGFIGGIKLEIQRQSMTQQLLDRQVAADEANVHPALRKGKENRRWSSPLKSPPPPPRAGVEGAEEERRYPPITRGKNIPYTAASLVSPTAPAIPDLSTIEKWRAKVGWKAIPRADAGMNPSHNAQSNLAGAAADLQQSISSRMEMKPTKVKRPSSPLPPKPTQFECPPVPLLKQKVVESKPNSDTSNNMSISSCLTDETYTTAPPPPSSPPPEPPRRSSKRNSVLSISDSIPPLPSPPQQYASAQSSPVREGNPSRSFPLCGDKLQSKNTSRDRAVGVAVPLNQTSLMLSSPGFAQLPSSSSEDSGSDDLNSTSILSTPATSRPQSENGISLETTNIEPPMAIRNHKPRLSLPNPTYPLHSTENSDDEGMDPIQAAAERVLAVFNDIPVRESSVHRRANSHSTLSVDGCFDAPLRERPLKLRPKTASGLPLQNHASPASYLEEARKQTPSVLIHRTRKQRLGPPASFVIPDSDSDTTASEKHMSTAPDVVGRSLQHKSTPLLSMLDREPIAKVFVECCGCKYYHDMPSNLYEAMANPDSVLSPTDGLGCGGTVSMTVRCPWCKHEMSMRCCAGLAATVYIKERLH